MTDMSPGQAREFWKALMDNASSLITDARTLLHARSYGRAHSLTVLAQEELGKALWIYEAFQEDWIRGTHQPKTVNALAQDGKSHMRKYLEAVVFGDELAEFWGEYSAVPATGGSYEEWEKARKELLEEAETAARRANLAKQRGFYVDQDEDDTILSPTAIPAGTTADDLQAAARVIEMLLINDHTRMKSAAAPYDSTHDQQIRLMPVAHPEEWAAATGSPDPDSERGGE